MTTDTTSRQRAEAMIDELGLTVTSVFVPFSQSKHAKPARGERPWPSLNWTVTLLRHYQPILTTTYSAGEGHCPAYKSSVAALGGRNSLNRRKAIDFELETGKAWRADFGGLHGKPLLPDTVDVIHSLVSDSTVLDCGTFEEWASDLGYDTDSRRAEATYRACLEIALKLRNGIGDANLQKLGEAFQDY